MEDHAIPDQYVHDNGISWALPSPKKTRSDDVAKSKPAQPARWLCHETLLELRSDAAQ